MCLPCKQAELHVSSIALKLFHVYSLEQKYPHIVRNFLCDNPCVLSSYVTCGRLSRQTKLSVLRKRYRFHVKKCQIGEKGRETLDKKIIFMHTYVCERVRALLTMYELVNTHGIFCWNQRNINISGC